MKTDLIIKSVVLAAAALWLLPVSEAQAAIPGADGVYAGCYNKSDKRIRVIDAEAGETCKDGETQITWNQTGPSGPVGPQGETGPMGPKGDKGDPGYTVRADGPCFNDNVNRYQDCGNGTVTDTVTGLIWLQQAGCLERYQWAEANNAAANLGHGQCGLTDNSSPGDWRLPTKEEWEATIARAVNLGCWRPSLTNTQGSACNGVEPQPFTGVHFDYYYWSSTTSDAGDSAFPVYLNDGSVYASRKGNNYYVWPVRGGR